MYYQQNLRSQLQERRNRVFKAKHEVHSWELARFLEFLQGNDYFRSLLLALQTETSTFDFDSWKETGLSGRRLSFPSSESGRARACYEMLVEMSAEEEQAWRIGIDYYGGSDIAGSLHVFNELFVDPFVDYLHDRVDEGSSVLYALERYKRRAEWFRRGTLTAAYAADTTHGERSLDADLRECLFEEGIDYPFSTPLSPSGRADVVADLETDDPLVLEVKLYDPSHGKDRGHVRQGLSQVRDYARDYNKAVGYLVVFNLTDSRLSFSTQNSDKAWPPRLCVDDRTFFLITVDVGPLVQPASKAKVSSCVIDEQYLLGQA